MLVKISDLSKGYVTGEKAGKRQILDHLSLEIGQGESIAIIGPSGSGKTTLLNLIGALDKPDKGEILFEGIDITQLDEKNVSVFRNEKIGFIFQLHHLLPQLNLWENVMLPTLANKQKNQEQLIERAKCLIARTGIDHVVNQKPGELSGGECQRTAFVRALVNQPKLLLADEPTGALDGHSADNLADLLVQLNREENTALIVVTHSMRLAEKMDKIYRLEDGKLTELKP